MAVGFGPADGVQDTIDATVNNAIDRARLMLQGTGTEDCVDCDNPIPLARRKAMPNATRCVCCQSKYAVTGETYYSRRGSKDSQLR